MRIHVAVDYHGIAGQVEPAVSEETVQELTSEVGAAVDAINSVVDDAVITVGSPEEARISQRHLDNNASVIHGKNRPYDSFTGAKGADATLHLGAHGGMSSGGVLEHTIDIDTVRGISLNNRPISEIELNSLLLDAWNTPLVFLSGDTVACDEAESAVSGIETVATKSPHTSQAATSYHPELVASDIKNAVAVAVQNSSVTYDVRGSSPYEAAATLTQQPLADKATMWPAVSKTDTTTVKYSAESIQDAYQFFLALKQL